MSGLREALIILLAPAGRATPRRLSDLHGLYTPLSPGVMGGAENEHSRDPSTQLPSQHRPQPPEHSAACDSRAAPKSIAGSFARVPHVRLTAWPSPPSSAGSRLGSGDRAQQLPALRVPSSAVSLGPRLGDEPSPLSSSAVRSPNSTSAGSVGSQSGPAPSSACAPLRVGFQ